MSRSFLELAGGIVLAGALALPLTGAAQGRMTPPSNKPSARSLNPGTTRRYGAEIGREIQPTPPWSRDQRAHPAYDEAAGAAGAHRGRGVAALPERRDHADRRLAARGGSDGDRRVLRWKGR